MYGDDASENARQGDDLPQWSENERKQENYVESRADSLDKNGNTTRNVLAPMDMVREFLWLSCLFCWLDPVWVGSHRVMSGFQNLSYSLNFGIQSLG